MGCTQMRLKEVLGLGKGGAHSHNSLRVLCSFQNFWEVQITIWIM